MTDFKIVLQTTLDTSQIKKQLEEISKNFKFNIDVGTTSSSSSGSSSSKSPSKLKFDDEMKYIALQEKANQQNQKFDADKIKREQEYIAMQEEANLMNQKFDNAEIQSQEKLNAEFAKYQQQVDIFLAKTQNRDLSKPGAQGALDVRTDMQGVLNGPITNEAVEQLDKLNGAAKVADANFQGLNVSTKTWQQSLGDVAKSLGLTYLAMQAVQEVMQGIKDGVSYIIELDTELNNIRLVTGQTKESADALGMTYNQMARDLGVTTLDITKSALEFQRQGKSIEDTNKLIEYSTKLAVLGNMDAANAAEKLTSVMNGYKLTLDEISPTLSKLVNLDNNFASSIDTIVTAMSYASQSAQQVGIDLDHLAAYDAVISHINPSLSGETIGQATKTMAARFADIKANKITDDDIGINDIDKALDKANIKLRDVNGNVRDMQDIIGELGKKWDTIDPKVQNLIIKTFAGKQRMPELMVT